MAAKARNERVIEDLLKIPGNGGSLQLVERERATNQADSSLPFPPPSFSSPRRFFCSFHSSPHRDLRRLPWIWSQMVLLEHWDPPLRSVRFSASTTWSSFPSTPPPSKLTLADSLFTLRLPQTHISKVKSLTLDVFTREQIESIRSMGNIKSNALINNDDRTNPPPTSWEDSARESELERSVLLSTSVSIST